MAQERQSQGSRFSCGADSRTIWEPSYVVSRGLAVRVCQCCGAERSWRLQVATFGAPNVATEPY